MFFKSICIQSFTVLPTSSAMLFRVGCTLLQQDPSEIPAFPSFCEFQTYSHPNLTKKARKSIVLAPPYAARGQLASFATRVHRSARINLLARPRFSWLLGGRRSRIHYVLPPETSGRGIAGETLLVVYAI